MKIISSLLSGRNSAPMSEASSVSSNLKTQTAYKMVEHIKFILLTLVTRELLALGEFVYLLFKQSHQVNYACYNQLFGQCLV